MDVSKSQQPLPASLRDALVLCVAFAAFTAWDQSHWWRLKEDYAFGWLAPVFAVYVVHDRWPRIVAAARGDRAGSAADGRGLGSRLGALIETRTVAWLAITGGAALFFLGALLRAAAGPSYPGTFALSVGLGGVSLGLIALAGATAATNGAVEGKGRSGGRALAGYFVFPALVWLVSAPMVSVLENALSLFLLGKVTATVFFVFEILGLPIEQQGNVLLLPTGQVGVAEACSGIRSLMGCVFAGTFFGAVFFERAWKKVALLVAAVGFAFFTNLLRSLFLTAWAYRHGPEAIEGRVHDLAGYAGLAVTAAGLLALVSALNMKVTFASGAGDGAGGKVES